MESLSSLTLIDHPDEIPALLCSVFGAKARLVDCRIINQADDYCVLFACLTNPVMEVLIKLAGPYARMAGQFDRTAAIHKLVARMTKIPMPETIAVDVRQKRWPWRFFIRTYLAGQNWASLCNHLDRSELADAYRQIGEAIGQLHSISFCAYGELDAHVQVVQSKQCLPALVEHATRIIPHPRLLGIFLAALDEHSTWFDGLGKSQLCHEDLHGSNILFNRVGEEWRLATILDFEKAWAGPAESDLARLELWKGMVSPDFWDAYRLWGNLEADYHQRRPIYQLLWCLEYARSTPEHLRNTRRVCLELGIPAIDYFE